MARADQLIKRIGKVLTNLKPTDRDVYKRVITRTGGDPLTGRGVNISSVDTKILPPPAVRNATDEDMLFGPSGLVQVGDIVLTILVTSIAEADLRSGNVALVLKGSDGSEHELFVVTFRPSVLEGKAIVFHVLARSKKR